MGADNWGTCPKCAKKASGARKRLAEMVEQAYGDVSESEYLNLLSQVKDPDAGAEYNLREDYEIWMKKSGEFRVSYYCKCSKCGFSHQFRKSEQVLKQT